MWWLWKRRKARRQLRALRENRYELPGSTHRIEKAMVLPTTEGRNPFLDRLDPSKAIKYYGENPLKTKSALLNLQPARDSGFPGTKGIDGQGE